MRGAEQGEIRTYDTNDRQYVIPLKKTAVAAATYVKPDTVEIDTEGASRIFKAVNTEFHYELVCNYFITERLQYDALQGSLSIELSGVTPRRDYYDDRGYFTGRYSMFTFKYDDLRDIINNYTQRHPFCNLPLELWQGYFMERE